MGWLEMGDTEGGRGHLRMGDGRMQHLQQVDEQVYKYASTQNRQDNAKYSILWVADGRMQNLQQLDEQVYKYASMQNRQDNAKY